MPTWLSQPSSWLSMFFNLHQGHEAQTSSLSHRLPPISISSSTSRLSIFSPMSSFPSQDQADALKPKDTEPHHANNERMPSPTPTSTQGPPAENIPIQRSTQAPSEHSSPQHRSSSVQPPGSKTAASPLISNTGATVNGQDGHNDQLLPPCEQSLGDSKDALEAYDWDELEERFHAKMEVCAKREEGIQEEFNELLEVFRAWVASGSAHEEERAGKRLRTRMAFAQQKEKTLEEKRTQYVKVVKAFESALALLSGA
ncbi:hypothetical protein ABVK25_001333 [Lepraria finkii]|uniref:Uncharacterized protein n=1 Tax=Lepraria finkii TaxID=1340010 RepID=A0ABR4BLK6_9LECA